MTQDRGQARAALAGARMQTQGAAPEVAISPTRNDTEAPITDRSAPEEILGVAGNG
jgi:hypothetical protein